MLKIKFDDIDSHDLGFHLNPSYVISSPDPKTSYIDIPYSSGSVDLTESITGDVQFKDRSIDFTLEKLRPKEEWDESLRVLLNKIHGKKMRIIVPYNDTHYFLGRVNVGRPNRNKILSVGVSILCDPYMYKNEITEVVVESTTTAKNVEFLNSTMKTVPEFICTGSVEISFKSTTFNVSAGTHKLPIVFEPGINVLRFKGQSKITVKYQEGEL